MPPPGRAATEQLGAFLARSILTVQAGLVLCGIGWITLGCWVAFCHPDRLGPARIVFALVLVVATAACPTVWWFARSWQRWLMVAMTELIPHLHDRAEPGGNLRNLADASRR